MDLSKVSTTNLFPTNIITYIWKDAKDLNKELKEMIFAEAKKTPSIQSSNMGGYHSPNDLLTWDYPCIKSLLSMIQSMSQIMARNDGLKEGNTVDLSLAAWSNIIQSDHFHAPHRHPNNFWSGVYYIDNGDPDDTVEYNGYFEFLDPRTGANMITNESLDTPRYQVNPKPGLMIMFPSWLEHYVHPYHGDSKRITIAFNVRVVQ